MALISQTEGNMSVVRNLEAALSAEKYLFARAGGLYLNDIILASTHGLSGAARRALAEASSISSFANGIKIFSKSMPDIGRSAERGLTYTSSVGSMVKSLRSRIQTDRAEARRVDKRSIIDIRLDKIRTLAGASVEKSGKCKTTKSTPVLRCSKQLPNGGRIHTGHDGGLVNLPPTWKAKVYDEGIAIADMTGGDKCLVVTAQRKTSTFLAEIGVTVHEVTAMRLGVSTRSLEGHVFSSVIGDSRVTVFHEFFNRGVAIIKAMIEEAVHNELEKVQ